jgi:hypothetical protein
MLGTSDELSTHHEHGPSVTDLGSGGMPAELFAQQPMLFEKSPAGFEDELELGHYFATEFQRWFDQFPQQHPHASNSG